jgi:hypothetical protein
MKKEMAAVVHRAISPGDARPWRHASTANGNAEAPEIKVRSRSKKAAAVAITSKGIGSSELFS